MKRDPLSIAGVTIQPGERVTLALPTPEIYTCAPLHIPMHIYHGRKEGPVLLICATFHGDEVNGIAIVQKLLQSSALKRMRGTLIAVPVMNVYGLINRSRSLPDGHDLAGSFPGQEKGAFASRIAHIFTKEVMSHCTHCLAIRSGAPHTYHIPQILFNNEHSKRLAEMFKAPVIQGVKEGVDPLFDVLSQDERVGLVFEGGEAHRTDEFTIRVALRGIHKLMRELEMIRPSKLPKQVIPSPLLVQESVSVRAPGSGLLHLDKKTGSHVFEGERLGSIADPFGSEQKYVITAPYSGVLLGSSTHPLVYEGQGILQLGRSEAVEKRFFEESDPIQPYFIS